MIELQIDRYKMEQENGQTILSFKKRSKWLTSKRADRFRLRNSDEKIITKIHHLRSLGISILDMTPTDEISHLNNSKVSSTRTTNTDLDMQEFLGIDTALKSITGELKNNVSK